MSEAPGIPRLAVQLLVLRGVLLCLCGLLLGATGLLGWNEYLTSPDALPAAFYVFWPVLLCSFGMVPGAVSFLVAWRLGKGGVLAWAFAIVLAALDVVSCFLPLGVALLYLLLKESTRRAVRSR